MWIASLCRTALHMEIVMLQAVASWWRVYGALGSYLAVPLVGARSPGRSGPSLERHRAFRLKARSGATDRSRHPLAAGQPVEPGSRRHQEGQDLYLSGNGRPGTAGRGAPHLGV